MKENTFAHCQSQLNNDAYIDIFKHKLDKDYYNRFGFLYEIEIKLNNDIIIDCDHYENYKDMKQYLKDEYNFILTQKDFKKEF